MLSELLSLNIFGFLLIFARVGTAFMTLPGFSATYVSTRARLLIGLTVSFVISPLVIPTLPVLPPTPVGLALLVAGEAIVGAFFGAIGRILLGAMHTAGTLIAYLSSMANAFIQDPISNQQGSIIAGFLTSVALIMIFVTDMHHVMLRAVTESYAVFPPGEMPQLGDMAQLLTVHVASAFKLGIQLASPFLLTGMTHYVLLGLLGRLMPALPVFFFGLPIQVATQIWILALTLSGIMLMFMTQFAEVFGAFVAP